MILRRISMHLATQQFGTLEYLCQNPFKFRYSPVWSEVATTRNSQWKKSFQVQEDLHSNNALSLILTFHCQGTFLFSPLTKQREGAQTDRLQFGEIYSSNDSIRNVYLKEWWQGTIQKCSLQTRWSPNSEDLLITVTERIPINDSDLIS